MLGRFYGAGASCDFCGKLSPLVRFDYRYTSGAVEHAYYVEQINVRIDKEAKEEGFIRVMVVNPNLQPPNNNPTPKYFCPACVKEMESIFMVKKPSPKKKIFKKV